MRRNGLSITCVAVALVASAHGQGLGQPVSPVTSDPSGSCTSGTAMRVNTTPGSGHVFACIGGTWTRVNPPGLIGTTQSSSLTFGAIADGAAKDLTFAFSGLAAGQALFVGLPSGLPGGVTALEFASAADTVDVRVINHSGGGVTLGALTFSATVITGSLTGNGTLSFGAIADGTCSGPQTFSITGANPGANLIMGWPATLEAGLEPRGLVSASSTVQVVLCNWSGASLTPASHTYQGMVP